jgi:RNA recognition motif-containing protein
VKNIYVGNLSYETTEQHLEALFSEHGTVSRVSVIRDRHSGESRGFGFVDMDNDSEADEAIKAVDGTELNGRALKVNEARPKAERRPGGGDGGRGPGGYHG